MSDEAREELTAYLDGELDAAAARLIEERLKQDPAYRDELGRLERAWDLLENLDRAAVGNAFSKTTLDRVAVAAAADARSWPWRTPALLLAIAALSASALVGLACGKWIWPDPNRELLGDLPVLENIDLYDQGDSLEFLRRLEAARLFDAQADAASAAAPPPAVAERDWHARRLEVEHMSPLERQHLRRKQDHFGRYSTEEQRRMLALHDDLERDPHGAELRRIMTRYHEWLDTLPLAVRAELVELPIQEQIARVEQLKAQQSQERARELAEAPTEQDLKTVLAWVQDMAGGKHDALLAGLSPERRAYIERLDPARQRQACLWLGLHRWHQAGQPEPPRATSEQLSDLARRLSPGAQLRLAALEGDAEKNQLVGVWMQTALRHRIEAVGIRQLLPPVDGPELQRFFRSELSAAQREWLLPMSREQRHRVLLRMYLLPTERLVELRPGQLGWPAAERGSPLKVRPKKAAKRGGQEPA